MPENVDNEELEKLKSVSVMWDLGFLEQVCVNLQKDEAFLNPSIGTYLNDETGARLKKLFFNSNREADVSFSVEGRS